MHKRKKIILAPLDWGIGHASRCVPLVKNLQKRGVDVMLAGNGRSASFLQSEFPDLKFIQLPVYDISYPRGRNMAWHMMKQSPAILKAISREHKTLETLISQYDIDAVVSDNRFGFWSDMVPSIYITHQLMIKAAPGWSFTEKMLYRFHAKYIKHFDECWIPDFEEDGGLSGDLAHKKASVIPAYFIGPQSRFSLPSSPLPENKYKLMAIISGPEPQRSIFEKMVLKQLNGSPFRSLVLLGKPEMDGPPEVYGNTEVHNHMNTHQMQEAILSSDLIICRSGYSSIMDLNALGSKAVFVPTPGQTEQEYLAAYHQEQGHYTSVRQDELEISDILQLSDQPAKLNASKQNDILNKRIDMLLARL